MTKTAQIVALSKALALAATPDLSKGANLVAAIRKGVEDLKSVTVSGANPKHDLYAYEVVQNADTHTPKNVAHDISTALGGKQRVNKTTDSGVFTVEVGEYLLTVRARPLQADEGEAKYLVSVRKLP